MAEKALRLKRRAVIAEKAGQTRTPLQLEGYIKSLRGYATGHVELTVLYAAGGPAFDQSRADQTRAEQIQQAKRDAAAKVADDKAAAKK